MEGSSDVSFEGFFEGFSEFFLEVSLKCFPENGKNSRGSSEILDGFLESLSEDFSVGFLEDAEYSGRFLNDFPTVSWEGVSEVFSNVVSDIFSEEGKFPGGFSDAFSFGTSEGLSNAFSESSSETLSEGFSEGFLDDGE